MLTSLFQNAPDVRFKVFLIHEALSDKCQSHIQAICDKYNHSFTPLTASHQALPNVPILEHTKIASYLRLLATHLLPEDLDRVLYLDADLIVRADLSPFYFQDLGNNYVAAIAQHPVQGRSERLGMDPAVEYFNAGVLLINLDLWRAEDLGNRTLQFAIDNADAIEMADQDALNGTCDGRVLLSSQRYNAGEWVFHDFSAEELATTPSELERARTDPAIAHYTGSSKPWDGSSPHPFAHEYFVYLKRTLYYGRKHKIKRLRIKGQQLLRKLMLR